jgi:hypothetical protein
MMVFSGVCTSSLVQALARLSPTRAFFCLVTHER